MGLVWAPCGTCIDLYGIGTRSLWDPYGICMGFVLCLHWIPVGSVWDPYGICIGPAFFVVLVLGPYRVCKGFVWDLHGICFKFAWGLYGAPMRFVWEPYGSCMDLHGICLEKILDSY